MKVEIWSDIACPFCFIGKRRFEKGLQNFEHKDEVEVQWRSYQLNPNLPKGEVTSILQFLINHKGISSSQAKSIFQGVTATAASEGLKFNFDGGFHSNTSDAHRLVHFASSLQPSKGDAMKERLLSAYFERCEKIGDLETLVKIGTEVLEKDAGSVRSVLTSNAFVDEVTADQVKGRQVGVTGVPFFLINGSSTLSGAGSAQEFTEALRKAWKKENPCA